MESDLATYYARRAGEYERIYERPERQRDLAVLRERCRDCFAGRDVLEIACGTGYWTQVIADAARAIVAVDVNDEVLALARNKPPGTAQLEFRRADVFALPDFGRRFDAAFAGFWWSHVPRQRLGTFLAGLHAQLEPGGRVMCIDNRYVEGNSTPIARVDARGDSFQIRTLADGSTHEVLKNFPSPSELIAAIASGADWAEVTLLDHFWILSYRLLRPGGRRKRTQFWGMDPEDDRLIHEILGGRKTATVCKADEYFTAMGEFDDGNMAVGDLIDVHDLRGRWRAMIRVTDVYPVKFGAIPEKLWRGEVCTSAEDFRDVHRRCWPQYQLTDDFELMATHFELVK